MHRLSDFIVLYLNEIQTCHTAKHKPHTSPIKTRKGRKERFTEALSFGGSMLTSQSNKHQAKSPRFFL